MQQYIFLTGQYMPKPGATGLCIHRIAEYLAESGNNVTVVCYEDGLSYQSDCGIQIFKIPVPAYLSESRSSGQFRKKAALFRSRLAKLIHLKRYPLQSESLVKRFAKAVGKLSCGKEDVTVVASVNPLEAVASLPLIRAKLPHAKLVYYCADTLSNEKGKSGILSAERRSKYGQAWERKLFEVSDLILIMECHRAHYFSGKFSRFEPKMRVANFPLLKRSGVCVPSALKKTIVYAGTLYRQLRNPGYICSVLPQVLEQTGYEAVFLGSGDCDDILHEAERKSHGRIRYIGLQPYEVARQYIDSAAILLSIGNAESQMAPSKIFEYIATGKPIIHVYSWEGDTCIEPLKKYGNALLLKDRDPDGIAVMKRFIDFAQMCDIIKIEQKFRSSTPQYTAEMIEDSNF